MTEPQWQTHTPQYDGHAPDDWDEQKSAYKPDWRKGASYRYYPIEDATHKYDLLAQCLALPQADRDALIEALQKRDWAEDVWSKADEAFGNDGKVEAAAVIRSMCRPKEEN